MLLRARFSGRLDQNVDKRRRDSSTVAKGMFERRPYCVISMWSFHNVSYGKIRTMDCRFRDRGLVFKFLYQYFGRQELVLGPYEVGIGCNEEVPTVFCRVVLSRQVDKRNHNCRKNRF